VVHYLDTSALAKLVVREAETDALMAWAREHAAHAVSSDLARTELLRAVRRAHPDQAERARDVLDSITLLALTPDVLEAAGRVEPVALRSLDAIHLAAALSLGDELDAIVTYDDRLAEAARHSGVHVIAPA
jgi:predicted nucleic acid-binding protein